VPINSEADADPKRRLVNVTHKSGRRAVRARIVPSDDQVGGKVGCEYLPVMQALIREH
jgi:hypothetical protein